MSGYNLYAYCHNNPVNNVDYSGQEPITLSLAASAVLLGGLIVVSALLVYDLTHDQILGNMVADAVAGISNFVNDLITRADESDTDVSDSVPEIDYPGDDPAKAPDGYEWRGSGKQGSKQGNYYNPNDKSSLHPDLDHPDPIGPHWDYSGPEGKFRIFPDGKISPK